MLPKEVSEFAKAAESVNGGVKTGHAAA